MENPELKSSSEDTLYPVQTEALLQPWRSIIEVPYKVLRDKFDEHFEANKTEIVNTHGIHGKKGKNGKIQKNALAYEEKVGYTALYYDILMDIVSKHVKDPFFIDGVALADFSPDRETAHLVVLYFNYPTLDLHSEPDYHCPNPVKQDEAGAWADKVKELQSKFRELTDYTGTGLPEENAELLLDIISSRDGKPFPSFTFRRRFFSLEQLPKTFRAVLEGHNVGDLFEVDYEVPDLQNEGGRAMLHSHIKIYECKTITYPEMNDDLAVKAGFESLEMLRNQFTVDYDEYVQRAKKSVAIDHVINQMISHSKLPQLPESCVFSNAKARMYEHIASCNNDMKQAMATCGAKNEEEMVKRFRSIVVREILQQLALRKYAEINNMDHMSPDLIDHVIDSVIFVDAIATEEK